MITDNPKKIKQAEIIVGIPSYNEAETIGFVSEQASQGLEKYFPNKQSVIINLDNNSPDGTKQAFFEAEVLEGLHQKLAEGYRNQHVDKDVIGKQYEIVKEVELPVPCKGCELEGLR